MTPTEEGHIKDRVYHLAALLERARDETPIAFTTGAVASEQKKEQARLEAEALKQELETEFGITIDVSDPRQIEVMSELFLLYTYAYPGFWVDHSKTEGKTS